MASGSLVNALLRTLALPIGCREHNTQSVSGDINMLSRQRRVALLHMASPLVCLLVTYMPGG